MTVNAIREGRAPFTIPSVDAPCQTFYKIIEDLRSGRTPVVVIHGGPGSGHEYLLPFGDLWSHFGIPVVFYDQIGCGSSTHLPHTVGDKSFWQVDLFVEELINLLGYLQLDRDDGPGFHVLGHSWGGTIAIVVASRQPRGLRRLILASTSASGPLFLRGLWHLKQRLPSEAQRAIDEAVRTEDFGTSAYVNALDTFSRMFLCRSEPYPPEEMIADRRNYADDATVRLTMQGPSPWLRNGSLEHWSDIPFLSRICAPTLLYNGEFDTTQEEPTAPLFNHIPRVRWLTLPGASHMCHLDSPEMREWVLGLVSNFVQPAEPPESEIRRCTDE